MVKRNSRGKSVSERWRKSYLTGGWSFRNLRFGLLTRVSERLFSFVFVYQLTKKQTSAAVEWRFVSNYSQPVFGWSVYTDIGAEYFREKYPNMQNGADAPNEKFGLPRKKMATRGQKALQHNLRVDDRKKINVFLPNIQLLIPVSRGGRGKTCQKRKKKTQPSQPFYGARMPSDRLGLTFG